MTSAGKPTLKEIIKIVNSFASVGTYELLADFFHMSAIAISNKISFDERREETYNSIFKKYDKKSQIKIVELFSNIFVLLSNQYETGFDDFLGKLYMSSGTSSKGHGQFFTPYHLSKLMAELSFAKLNVDYYKKNSRVLRIVEPSCGSGGSIIAAVDILYNKYDINYARNVFVECSDIDPRCVHMCYLQLALAGVPGIVYHQNTLTSEIYDKWETPAYIFDRLRFDYDLLKGAP